MNSRRTTFLVYIQFAIAAIFPILYQSHAYGIRAGLDYAFEVVDGAESKTVTCDMCGYSSFADHNTFFVPQSINTRSGYVQIIFLKKSDYTTTYTGPAIDYNDITLSLDKEFYIDYRKVVRVNKGQTVQLKGTNIKVKIIDVIGSGCPPGAQC